MDAILVETLFDIRVASALIAISFSVIIYWYYTRNHDYWKKRGVPYVDSVFFFGSGAKSFDMRLEEVEQERYAKYGRIYGAYEFNTPILTVAEPELLRNILVKDFHIFTNRRDFIVGDSVSEKMLSLLRGEDWKRVRTIMSPTFSTGKIKRVMSIFQDSSKSVVQNIKMQLSSNSPIDVIRIYGSYTIDVIASSAFSTKIDSLNEPDNLFVKNAKEAFGNGVTFKLLLFILFPRVMKFFGASFFGKENMKFFQKVTLEIIRERRRTKQKCNDFLQLMMDTAEETAKEENWNEKDDGLTENYRDELTNNALFKSSASKHLSMDELVSQCVSFFVGGYHTTTTTLAVTTYLLALHQEEQENVFQEIKEVLIETDGILSYESVPKMKYLDNVISEALRLYSPVLRIERQAEADYKLGDTGITVTKGMIVGIPVFAMHHDPDFFPEPEKFKPNRFGAEEKENLTPYTFLPFGAGPRNCLGMRFALLEIKICLIYTISVFHIQKCSETKVPLELGKGLGILAPKPIYLKFEERNDCPLKM